MNKGIIEALENIRTKKPLILNLTNAVTTDFVANTLLAIGAAPIMSESIEELHDLIPQSDACVINLGTLNKDFIKRCQAAISLACRHNVPIVLDPVGAGASQLRTDISREFMKEASIIRGNASEIRALMHDSSSHGVESVHATKEAIHAAKQLSDTHHLSVVISGEVDRVTDGTVITHYQDGSRMMQHVTGMGCCMSAVIAAFRSVNPSSYDAAALATQFYSHCGSLANKESNGPASFKMNFIDILYQQGYYHDS